MSTEQLAKRLGVVQQRIGALEKAESQGVVKLKSLEEAAMALDCKLIYFLVLTEPIETMIKKQAYIRAKKIIEQSTHTMELEAQPISPEEKVKQIEELAEDLLMNRSKELWNDE